jgi:hypothetical protein
MEELLAKQAKERKELVVQQTILRKTIANAGKKEKKEIKTKIEELETDLRKLHAAQVLEVGLGASTLKEQVPVKTEEISTKKEPSKQQKRKARKAEEERQMRKEAEEEAKNMPDQKKVEQDAIDKLIGPLNLCIQQVKTPHFNH